MQHWRQLVQSDAEFISGGEEATPALVSVATKVGLVLEKLSQKRRKDAHFTEVLSSESGVLRTPRRELHARCMRPYLQRS